MKRILKGLYKFYFISGLFLFKKTSRFHSCLVCRKRALDCVYKDLFICQSCGTLQKRPQPNKFFWKLKNRGSVLSACFDEDIALGRMKEAEEQLEILEKFTSPGKLFDVGCNAGFFMKAAKDKGWQVEGNDISREAINLGRERFGFNIMLGYLDELTLNSNHYDAINLWNVLEHMHNPIEALKRCRGLLKVNGILMVKLPHKTLHNIIEFYEPSHLFEWDKDVSHHLIQEVGFKRIWSRIDERPQDELIHIESFYQKI